MSILRTLSIPLLISTTLLLSGCNGIMREDNWNVLNSLNKDGPEVSGIQATLLENAQAAEKRGEFLKAQQMYAQLISYDKENIAYTLAYADASRRGGAREEALSGYEKIISEHPKHIAAIEGKGLTQLAANDLQGATRSFSQVMQMNPKRWKTLNALGLLFVAQSRPDDAMAYFTEALLQSPNNVSVLNNVGLTLALQSEYIDAIEALETASDLVYKTGGGAAQGKHVDMNLAMVYGISGNMDAAERTANKHYQGAALSNNLGFYAHLAKDDQLAKSYLNMALSQSSSHYERAWENLEIISKGQNQAGNKGAGNLGAKSIKVD